MTTPRTATLAEWLLEQIAADEAAFKGFAYHRLIARVRAECESKRKIVEHHEPTSTGETCLICRGDRDEWDSQPYPCLTLRLLAAPYADREDFRDEWRAQ